MSGTGRRAEGLRVVALTPTSVLSGAERALVQHAMHGRDRGDRWTILSPDGPTGDRVRSLGIGHVVVPELKLGGGPRPLAAIALAVRNVVAALAVATAVRDADVIVANSVMVLPLLRLVRPTAPVVWLVHDVITRGDLRQVARVGAPVVTRSVAVSHAAGALSRQLGLPTEVVYNGVDTGPAAGPDDRTTAPAADDVPIVGLNGVLTHWKGHHVLLEAVARLDRPVVVELLGGQLPKDGAYRRQLLDRSERPDLRGRVRIVGHREDPATTMRRWSVAVSASVEPEAGSLAVLEAMALGLPVVVSDHGGAPEMLGDAGVAVPPDDPVALAAAIDELLSDPDRCAALGRAARDLAVARFRREERQEQFRDALRSVAHCGGASATTSDDAPLRVLFVNENIGGHATVHHHLRAALAAHPDVEATFLDVPAPSLLRRVVGASLPALGPLDLDLQPLRAQLALSAWVRRRLTTIVDEFDVVHLYTQNAGLTSVGLLGRRPLVVSLDTTNARNAYRLPYRAPTRWTPLAVPFSTRAERRVFAVAHRVVANSRWAADSLREDYGLDDASVVTMPFGITDPGPPAARSRDHRPRIVFLGRQFDRKGGPVLLDAWRRSCADRADLVLVTKDHVPAEPGVTVVDDLDQGDSRLWDVLGDADVLAFPSTIDQAPNAVIEAMAAGLPVVAVPVAGTAEMVVDGVTGIHVAADDPDDLGRALARLVDDPSLRSAMGAAGRERFEEVYDASASTARLVDLLREAAGSARPSRTPAVTDRLRGPATAVARAPRRRAAPGAVVLGYHDVTAPGTGSTDMSVSADDLDGHLTTLGRLGLRVVHLDEIVERLVDGRRVDGLAAVTFDDALLGVHRHAVDVLARHGVAATVFAVTGHPGVEPPWWPGMPRTLTDAALGELVAAGHRLGSHTTSHRSLPTLDDAALVDELERSRDHLAGVAGDDVRLLAYPSGHHDARVRSAARAAGYLGAVTFLNGRVDGGTDPFRIPRLTMGAHMTSARLAYHLLRSPGSWPDHQLDAVGAVRAGAGPSVPVAG